MYGAFGRVVGGRGEPGGQRAAQPVGRVDVTAEHHHRDMAGARPLERGGRGLGAGARYPGVVKQQHTGSRRGPFGRIPVRVRVPALLARPDDQPRHREPQVRGGQLEQRVRSRAAAAGRHHGQAAGRGHARVPPHAAAVIVQEGEQQGQQRRPRGGARRPPGLVAPQIGGERRALHRVGDGRHGVGEQAPGRAGRAARTGSSGRTRAAPGRGRRRRCPGGPAAPAGYRDIAGGRSRRRRMPQASLSGPGAFGGAGRALIRACGDATDGTDKGAL